MIIEYNLTSLCTNMHVIPAFCRGMEGWNSEPVKCAFRSNSKFWKFYWKKSQITLWQSFFPIYSKHMDSNFQCIHAVLTPYNNYLKRLGTCIHCLFKVWSIKTYTFLDINRSSKTSWASEVKSTWNK